MKSLSDLECEGVSGGAILLPDGTIITLPCPDDSDIFCPLGDVPQMA